MFKTDRRNFLGGLFGAGAVTATAQLQRLFPEMSLATPLVEPVIPADFTDGELFSGFLILPEGVKTPDWVAPSRRGTPIVCGTGADRGGPEMDVWTSSRQSLKYAR